MKAQLIKFAVVALVAAVGFSASAASSYRATIVGPNLPLGGTALMVLDLDMDGADGQSYESAAAGSFDNFSDFFWDADDEFSVLKEIVFFPPLGGNSVIVEILGTEAPAGKDIIVLFFDAAFGAAGPGENTPYGVINLGQTVDPSAGQTITTFGGLVNIPAPEAAFQTNSAGQQTDQPSDPG